MRQKKIFLSSLSGQNSSRRRKRKILKYILSIVDKNIKNGFGGDDGIEEFKEWWKIDDPKSEFWETFLPVITNGGRFVKEEGTTSFYAP